MEPNCAGDPLSEPTQPHDALFKKTFSDIEHAAAELRAVLPAELVSRTDFSTLTLCSGGYIDETLAGSQSDLLFSVRVSGKPALLYILFEHQSSLDGLLPLRLLRYVVRILERYIDEAKHAGDALPLPVVVPVVLYHGAAGWSVATRLEDLFDRQSVEMAGLSQFIPRLSFVLDDLSHVTDDELEQRELGLVALLTLWLLRDARTPARLVKSASRFAVAMANLLETPNGLEAFATLFRYIGLVADDSAAITLSQAIEAAKPEAKEPIMTLAEKWKAEGEAKGKAETLRKLLTLKFGNLSEAAVQSIANVSEVELDRWLERVLTADSLDAVVGD
jgi:predicted transposase/invertase (TIGR01784 family)